MSYSFIQPRDPSIDVYNRPRPQQTRLLEPLLLEEEEENSSDSASCSRDATGSSENIAIGEGKAEVYLRLRTLRTGESVQRLFETTLTGLKVLGQKTDTCGRSKAPCTQLYTFTKVFEPLSDQKDIYHSAMRKHIDNEEHAVFLTYGTSGSGKTYTLLGKDVFGKAGKYSVIMKRVQLPMVPAQQCQTALQNTRLGPTFRLDPTFVCAGGIPGIDTCTGDGGAPLVCPVGPSTGNRYVQTGIVSWGIGCKEAHPAVYTHVALYRNWIDQHMRNLNFGTNSYTAQ